MKESIGGTQIFVIVIVLVILFTGIMAFTINYTNAFAVKDKIVSIIENNGYFDMQSSMPNEVLQEIIDALKHYNYRQEGDCILQADEANIDDNKVKVIAYDRDGTETNHNNASFCIMRLSADNAESGMGGISQVGYYYQVILFYSLDIPIINELFNFRAIGQTKILYG